jgi:hypothetical protein
MDWDLSLVADSPLVNVDTECQAGQSQPLGDTWLCPATTWIASEQLAT